MGIKQVQVPTLEYVNKYINDKFSDIYTPDEVIQSEYNFEYNVPDSDIVDTHATNTTTPELYESVNRFTQSYSAGIAGQRLFVKQFFIGNRADNDIVLGSNLFINEITICRSQNLNETKAPAFESNQMILKIADPNKNIIGVSDGNLACDATKNIVFKFSNKVQILKSYEYIDIVIYENTEQNRQSTILTNDGIKAIATSASELHWYNQTYSTVKGGLLTTNNDDVINNIFTNGTFLNIIRNIKYSYIVETKKVKQNDPLYGKKIAFIGDSITAYTGYTDTKCQIIYPGYQTSNVRSWSDMWWGHAIKGKNMILTGVSAAASSRISYKWNEPKGKGMTHNATSTYRINECKFDGVEPDIIVIFIGVNDFSESKSIGTYDGLSQVQNEQVTSSSYTSQSFSDAYAVLLKKVLTTYTKAIVYCCSLFEYQNSTISHDIPFTNNGGYPLAAYNKQIETISKAFGCRYINLQAAGINWKVASQYTTDGIHPNAAGHKLLGQYVGSQIQKDFLQPSTNMTYFNIVQDIINNIVNNKIGGIHISDNCTYSELCEKVNQIIDNLKA